MKRNLPFVVMVSLVLLMLPIASTVARISSNLVSSHPQEIKPLTDPSEAVQYDLDEINAVNPESPYYGKHPFPDRDLSELTDQDPDHLSFGTSIKTNQNINGVFARQEVIDNLELGSGENRALCAPTLTAPEPCPVESSTVYWRYSGYSSTARWWGIYNFAIRDWVLVSILISRLGKTS